MCGTTTTMRRKKWIIIPCSIHFGMCSSENHRHSGVSETVARENSWGNDDGDGDGDHDGDDGDGDHHDDDDDDDEDEDEDEDEELWLKTYYVHCSWRGPTCIELAFGGHQPLMRHSAGAHSCCTGV